MKFFSNLLPDPAISAFGWTLIHSIWQGFALMLIGFAAFYFLRKKSANARYLTSVGLLFTQVLASVATFIYYFPKTTAAIPNATYLARYTALSATRAWTEVSRELPVTLKMQMWLTAHLHELVMCWLIGSGLLLLRFAGGWIFTQRLRANAKIVMDKEWRARFGVMIAKMNISKAIEFRETAKLATPLVIGAFAPVVLIPIGFLSGFSTAQVEAILAHELAHIRRNDYLINMLQSLVEVVFFFHPAIWWLSEKVRSERENCCDDIALNVCGDKMSFAHALMKVAEWQSTPGLAMAFASKKPLLLHRVQRVLGLNPKPARTFSSLPAIIFAISLALGVSAYAVAQKVEKNKKKEVAKISQKKHSVKKPHQKVYAYTETPDFEAIADVVVDEVEMEVPDIDLALDINVGFDMDMPFHSDNDSLNQKLHEINLKISAMHEELKSYHAKLDELSLEKEKYEFESERFGRDIEKIEWKKRRAMELREDLMEKRSVIFDQDTKETKVNEADLDKQIADFEQQIKTQEQAISDFNNQIATAKKEAFKAEEPERNLQKDITDLHYKISQLGHKIGAETRIYQQLQDSEEPKFAKAPKAPRTAKVQRVPPPAPAPPPAKVANPPKAPKPPVAPAKNK